MTSQSHTDLVILDTIVQLVRQVPWGPTRDQLEKIAADDRIEASIMLQAGAWDAYNKLAWNSELHILAAEGRFPRPGDDAADVMSDQIVDQINDMQHGKRVDYPFPGHIAIREGVTRSIERHGFDLDKLPLPPTLHELIDIGADRPKHITQLRWDQAIEAYNDALTLENTPALEL